MKEYNRKKWMGATLTVSSFVITFGLGLLFMLVYAFYSPSPNDSYQIYLVLLLAFVVGGGYGILVILFNKYTWIYHLLFFITFIIGILIIFRASIRSSFEYTLFLFSPYIIFYIRDFWDKMQNHKNKGEK